MPFHCHISSVRVAGGVGAVDYLAREGDYQDRADLEHLAGDPEAVRTAAEEIDAGARIRNGDNAERILVIEVLELPAASTPAARREIAEALVRRWQDQGHEAVAAVHMPAPKPDGRINPHIHLAVAARPRVMGWDTSRPDGGSPAWRRDRSVRLMVGKAAVQTERRAVADLVNSVMAAHGLEAPEFVGGRLRDVGIDRPPRRRVPEAAYQAGQREPDLTEIAAARARHLAEAKAAKKRRKDKDRKRIQRLEQRGLVTMAQASVQADWAATKARVEAEDQARRRLADERPATARELRLVFQMCVELGVEIADTDVPATRAAVNTWIAQLKAARKAAEASQKAQDVPQPPQPAPSLAKPSALARGRSGGGWER